MQTLEDPQHVRVILQFDLFRVAGVGVGNGTEFPEGKFNYTQKLKELNWSLLQTAKKNRVLLRIKGQL